jgi:membrane-bound lytic murein transglycosylase B
VLKKKGEPDKFHNMEKCGLNHKIRYLLFILFIPLSSMAYGDDVNKIPSSYYQTLIDRLSQEEFNLEFLSKVLTDPRAGFIPELTRISLISKETPESYAKFLRPELILLSKKFLRQNLKALNQMEKEFHVDKEVVVAILLVESRFGENIGKHRIIPTLASMALMDSPDCLQRNYLNLQETNPELSFERIEGLARRKAKWAYHELKCFLKIIRHEEIDPLEVYGSYAGALGMAQFIPSSYLSYAVSQKSFERWLLGKDEAIFSIGNYLRSHGWKKNLSIKRKRQILWYYNRSEPYVETILQVAQKIINGEP